MLTPQEQIDSLYELPGTVLVGEPPATAAAIRTWVRDAVGPLALLCATWITLPLLPVHTILPPAVNAVIYGAMYFMLLEIAHYQLQLLRAAPEALPLVGGSGVLLACVGSVVHSQAMAQASKVICAVAIGIMLSVLVNTINAVLLLGLTITIVDTWNVFSPAGIANQLATSGKDSVLWDVLVITLPHLGTTTQLGIVGAVDIALASFFIAVAWQWQLGPRRMTVLLVAAILLLDLLSYVGGVPLLPVLPFLVVAFLVCSPNVVWSNVRSN